MMVTTGMVGQQFSEPAPQIEERNRSQRAELESRARILKIREQIPNISDSPLLLWEAGNFWFQNSIAERERKS